MSSDNDITGALAEMWVQNLFTQWGWQVGRYWIDDGYDMTVMPDHRLYGGRQFLVQVKGTAKRKSKGSVVAPVDKFRLQQYATNLDPVFIIRVIAGDVAYWLHAQEWCGAHAARLSGNGRSGVKIDPTSNLSNRVAFESYLTRAFAESRGRVAPVVSASPEVLQENPGAALANEGAAQPLELTFSFPANSSPENIANLTDAIRYGLPRMIDMSAAQIAMPADLVSSLQIGNRWAGSMRIESSAKKPCSLHLYPGPKRSVLAQPLRIEAEFFQGMEGAAVANDNLPSLIDLTMRVDRHTQQQTVALGLRRSAVGAVPLRACHALGQIASWADQVLLQKTLHAELNIPAYGVREVSAISPNEDWGWFATVARTIGRLHLIARTLDSGFTLPSDFQMHAEEMECIDLAYSLLRGDRRGIRFDSSEVRAFQGAQGEHPQDRKIDTNFALSIDDSLVANIPVLVEFPKVEGSASSEADADAVQIDAWMFYNG